MKDGLFSHVMVSGFFMRPPTVSLYRGHDCFFRLIVRGSAFDIISAAAVGYVRNAPHANLRAWFRIRFSPSRAVRLAKAWTGYSQ